MNDDDLPPSERRLQERAANLLRRQASKSLYVPPPIGSKIFVEFSPIAVGSFFHSQASGWRAAPDALVEKMEWYINEVNPYTDPEDRRVHREANLIQLRDLVYPWLASWRLCVEVALKEAINYVSSLCDRPLSNTRKKTLLSHDIARLWAILADELGYLQAVVSDVETKLGLDSSPGFDLESSRWNGLIVTLTKIDPDGQALRYASDKNEQINMQSIGEIDVTSLHFQLGGAFEWITNISRVASVMEIYLSHAE